MRHRDSACAIKDYTHFFYKNVVFWVQPQNFLKIPKLSLKKILRLHALLSGGSKLHVFRYGEGGGYIIRGLGHKISCVDKECDRQIIECESGKNLNMTYFRS